jgi:hypothetical protein
MKPFPLIVMVAAAAFTAGCNRPTVVERIVALPPIIQAYKADPYIEVAAELQSLGRETACSALLAAAAKPSSFPQYSIYVLCRMVFTNNPGGTFRRPGLGAATFVGETTYSDCPLEPIEIVDGVPFVIAIRYQIGGGQMEPPSDYVRYCMTECIWSSTKFTPRTRRQKETALAKLLISRKWRNVLSQSDRDYLADQLR